MCLRYCYFINRCHTNDSMCICMCATVQVSFLNNGSFVLNGELCHYSRLRRSPKVSILFHRTAYKFPPDKCVLLYYVHSTSYINKCVSSVWYERDHHIVFNYSALFRSIISSHSIIIIDCVHICICDWMRVFFPFVYVNWMCWVLTDFDLCLQFFRA